MKKSTTHSPWLVVIVLMLAYAFAFIDRYILNLLVEPMKRDLGISDTQVSLLLGLSFALFYATLGIPLGRLADTKNRKNLIAVGVALWSFATAVSGVFTLTSSLLDVCDVTTSAFATAAA